MKICTVLNCEKNMSCRGMCYGHYQRYMKHGDAFPDKPLRPMVNTTRHLSIPERFWMKVDAWGDCWEWIPEQENVKKNPHTYGKFKDGDHQVVAHRWAYEYLVGPIPEGLNLDHLCKNTICVNPDHLEPVTQQVNVLRSYGVTSLNAKKTHCIHGHEYTPENTVHDKNGRSCRTCRNQALRESRARAKARAQAA